MPDVRLATRRGFLFDLFYKLTIMPVEGMAWATLSPLAHERPRSTRPVRFGWAGLLHADNRGDDVHVLSSCEWPKT